MTPRLPRGGIKRRTCERRGESSDLSGRQGHELSKDVGRRWTLSLILWPFNRRDGENRRHFLSKLPCKLALVRSRPSFRLTAVGLRMPHPQEARRCTRERPCCSLFWFSFSCCRADTRLVSGAHWTPVRNPANKKVALFRERGDDRAAFVLPLSYFAALSPNISLSIFFRPSQCSWRRGPPTRSWVAACCSTGSTLSSSCPGIWRGSVSKRCATTRRRGRCLKTSLKQLSDDSVYWTRWREKGQNELITSCFLLCFQDVFWKTYTSGRNIFLSFDHL